MYKPKLISPIDATRSVIAHVNSLFTGTHLLLKFNQRFWETAFPLPNPMDVMAATRKYWPSTILTIPPSTEMPVFAHTQPVVAGKELKQLKSKKRAKRIRT